MTVDMEVNNSMETYGMKTVVGQKEVNMMVLSGGHIKQSLQFQINYKVRKIKDFLMLFRFICIICSVLIGLGIMLVQIV